MKRLGVYAIGGGLVVAAAVGTVIALHSDRDHTDKPAAPASASTAFPRRQACSIFTLADAKQVLGDTAKGGTGTEPTSSDSLAVSICDYTQDSGSNSPVSATKSASLLVRAPKSGAGTTSNQNQFGYLKPADAQAVSGYGDTAYWDPQYGQLDILKHNTWYIVSNGPITPSQRTLDQAKQLADLLIDKM